MNDTDHLSQIMYIPPELVAEILSYGDVMVTQKYDGVLRQLTYHKNQFMYHRNYNRISQWYLKPESYYVLYILMKNSIKSRLDEYIYTHKSLVKHINTIFWHGNGWFIVNP